MRQNAIVNRRLGLFLGLFGLLAGVSCTDGDTNTTVLDRGNIGGVVRTGPQSFALLVYPCDDTMVSEVALVVNRVTANGEVETVQEIVSATYDPPVSSHSVLISTAESLEESPGVVRVVSDSAALRRFNEDDRYMTTIDLDSYLSVDAWDQNGDELVVTGTLTERLLANVGDYVHPDYRRPLDSISCPGGKPAWTTWGPGSE